MSNHDWSDDFSILRELDFFNHAGVAPISQVAAQAIRQYAEQAAQRAYIGAGWYRTAREVKRKAAQLIHARGEHEIAFVANTSTGLSLVAKGLTWRRGDNVVISNVEYPANRYPWQDLTRLGVELIEVPEQSDGRILAEDVCDAITDRTRIVAISHVQYASGYRIELARLAQTVHQAGGYLCVDGIQSVGVLPVDVQAMGIDFLAADGHKWLLSPEGCGVFYCHENLLDSLHPNIVGWMNMVNASDYGNYQFEFENDARRFEPGSYNIPGILGLGASLDLLLKVGIDTVWSRVDALTTQLCAGLPAAGYQVFSPRQAHERSGIVCFTPIDSARRTPAQLQRLVQQLEARKIVIVIREGRLRVSPHFYNTPEQIQRLLAALRECSVQD